MAAIIFMLLRHGHRAAIRYYIVHYVCERQRGFRFYCTSKYIVAGAYHNARNRGVCVCYKESGVMQTNF